MSVPGPSRPLPGSSPHLSQPKGPHLSAINRLRSPYLNKGQPALHFTVHSTDPPPSLSPALQGPVPEEFSTLWLSSPCPTDAWPSLCRWFLPHPSTCDLKPLSAVGVLFSFLQASLGLPSTLSRVVPPSLWQLLPESVTSCSASSPPSRQVTGVLASVLFFPHSRGLLGDLMDVWQFHEGVTGTTGR